MSSSRKRLAVAGVIGVAALALTMVSSCATTDENAADTAAKITAPSAARSGDRDIYETVTSR